MSATNTAIAATPSPRRVCVCGHTERQHYRVKYVLRESKTGCSRCTCFELQADPPLVKNRR